MGSKVTGQKRLASPQETSKHDAKKRARLAESDAASDASSDAGEYSDAEDGKQEQQVKLTPRLERNLQVMIRRVRSALKETRKGEVLRAIKRLQAAKGASKANKKGKEEADPEDLVKELDVTKHVPLDLLAHRVVARKLVRARLLPKAKVLQDLAHDAPERQSYPLLTVPSITQQPSQLIDALLAEAHGALKERVYERFTSSKAVAAAAGTGVEKLEALLARYTKQGEPAAAPEGKTPQSKAESSSGTKEDKPVATEVPAESTAGAHSGSEEDNDAPAPEEVPELGEEWDALVGSGSEGEDESDDDGPLPESDYDAGSGNDQDANEESSGPQDDLDEDEDDSDQEDGEDDSDDDDSGSEGGLPSLAAGYVDKGVRLSGRGDASDYSDDEPDAADGAGKQRKNRMGQRARRALWEKKFGRGAKHIQSELEAKRKERPARGRGAARGGRDGGPGRGGFAPRSTGFGANDTPLGNRPAPPTTKPKPAPQERPEHPSWVAKMQQKKQAEAKPQGKKMMFD